MLRFTMRMYLIALTLRVKTNTLSSFSSCHMVYVSFFFFSFWRIMHTSFFSCQLCKRATAKVSCLRIRSKFDLHLHQNKKRTLISVGNFFFLLKSKALFIQAGLKLPNKLGGLGSKKSLLNEMQGVVQIGLQVEQ